MSTSLHSLIDIFNSDFQMDTGAVQLKKIVIPSIQRDYAQGRLDPDVTKVRERFLNALYNAVTETPITLDFVYGDIDENGILTPLDGQQRLTTLFLLHWYAAKKQGVPQEDYAFLENFSYETRYSARYFCHELVGHMPTFEKTISEEIIDQAWFPLDWQKDPTISSMLNMLDAINAKFKEVVNLWDALKNNAITFYFLPIKDMGLTDELYIKMNSRGKPLTLFEHFKAELERELRAVDEPLAVRIMNKIDLKWTDLLWAYRNSSTGNGDDNIIDDEFLRYFKFICDIICYEQGNSPQERNNDEFELLEAYFSAKNAEETMQNVLTLEKYFDCWCHIDGFDNPTDFLESFMTFSHEYGKVTVDQRYSIDIFKDCLTSYSDRSGRLRIFPLNRIVLLYGITCYLQNQTTIKMEDFIRRLRIVNNLIQNSEDEVSDRSGNNRIPAILKQVKAIICNGIIDDSIENNFNVNQLTEEKEKAEYLNEHPNDAPALFELEDHPMLKGQISIIGIENLSYGKRFESLFTCSWDLIDCALMSIGNYAQQERNKWRHQVGSNSMQYAWDELFHKSANKGYENTKNILVKLLETSETFTDSILTAQVNAFIQECETKSVFPWEYYYVKYPVCRPGKYGKLSNDDTIATPYMYSIMQTKTQWSSNTYIPYFKAIDKDDKYISRDEYGQRMVFDHSHIICENAFYVVRRNDTGEIIDTIYIAQIEDVVDTENRIDKLAAYIDANKTIGVK